VQQCPLEFGDMITHFGLTQKKGMSNNKRPTHRAPTPVVVRRCAPIRWCETKSCVPRAITSVVCAESAAKKCTALKNPVKRVFCGPPLIVSGTPIFAFSLTPVLARAALVCLVSASECRFFYLRVPMRNQLQKNALHLQKNALP